MPHAQASESTPPPPVEVAAPLFVNDGPLHPSEVGLLKRSSPDLPVEELRRRYAEDGYVFLKGLIPRPVVTKAREQYFKYLAPTGILKPGTSPEQGIFDATKDKQLYPGIGAGAAGSNGHPGQHAATFVDMAIQTHYQDWYAEEFCRNRELFEFVQRFSGWQDDTFFCKRSLLRNNVPETQAIGVHYDQIFLRYGEPTSVTAWVPIGDVSVQGGGLIYLEKGYQIGRQFEADFFDKAKATGLSDEEAKNAFNSNMLSTGLLSPNPAEFGREHGRRWLVSDYEAGDVVLHNPYAIHASTINRDPEGVIRLATDLRFVDSSRPWDKRWDKHYELNDGV